MSRFERHGQRALQRPRRASSRSRSSPLLLVLFAGGSIRDAGGQIDPGIGRDIVEAVGEPPAGSPTSSRSPRRQHELTGGLSPDDELGGGGFDEARAATAGGAARCRR